MSGASGQLLRFDTVQEGQALGVPGELVEGQVGEAGQLAAE
ncbi:hypothetical protein [Nonomuraea helvata]|uniref:Uncharacterized protein n=1 Tax=Nonomuraea helvata TaxID=37484 RepID=A0ABV5RXA0_9ACTN